jgi:DNA-binding response OmpR family regulator
MTFLKRGLAMGQKKLILIVDDDVSLSGMAKAMLEKVGHYEVEVCNRGEEALEVIGKKKPDLILLDVVMPGVDGPEIAGKLRADKALSAIPVIFLTSLVSHAEAAHETTIGGYPFIAKPVAGEDLVKRVRDFLKS